MMVLKLVKVISRTEEPSRRVKSARTLQSIVAEIVLYASFDLWYHQHYDTHWQEVEISRIGGEAAVNSRTAAEAENTRQVHAFHRQGFGSYMF